MSEWEVVGNAMSIILSYRPERECGTFLAYIGEADNQQAELRRDCEKDRDFPWPTSNSTVASSRHVVDISGLAGNLLRGTVMGNAVTDHGPLHGLDVDIHSAITSTVSPARSRAKRCNSALAVFERYAELPRQSLNGEKSS